MITLSRSIRHVPHLSSSSFGLLMLAACNGCHGSGQTAVAGSTSPSASSSGRVSASTAPIVSPSSVRPEPDAEAIRSQTDCPDRMIFIPGGRFEFTGPVPGDKDKTQKKQSFQVEPFCIDEFEAPDAYKLRGIVLSYRAVEASCGSRDPECLREMRYGGPLTCVTPAQAECYCANILPGTPKRLPTDQEFLFAALGTDGRLFPWGNELYPDGKWGATPDFCSFEPNVEPKANMCAPWANKRDRSPYGVIGMATNGSEITVLSDSPNRKYAVRGYSHESQYSDRDSIGLARWPGVLSELETKDPFLSFRCVVSKRHSD